MSPPRRSRSSGRRGIAIGAVLLVGLGVLLIVVGTLHFVRAGVVSIGGVDGAVQSRFAARSAVRALAGLRAEDIMENREPLSHTVPVAGLRGTSAACSHTYLPNVKWVVPGGTWLF